MWEFNWGAFWAILAAFAVRGIWRHLASREFRETVADGFNEGFRKSAIVSPAPEEATAYCNACGKLNWAAAPTCHFCRAPMTAR
jgi:hypothetical protein